MPRDAAWSESKSRDVTLSRDVAWSESMPRRSPRDRIALDVPYHLSVSLPRVATRDKQRVNGVSSKRVEECAVAPPTSRRHSVDSDIMVHLAECRCPCEHLGFTHFQVGCLSTRKCVHLHLNM